jgi:superfamily II DNA/RNA helicase
MSFAELGLAPALLKAVAAKGYDRPTPVQRQAIPAALEGGDLLVSSQTGSGKTAAFMLPCLQRLEQPSAAAGVGPRILVLTPTRELAQQVHKAADDYGLGLRRVRTASVVGGTPYAIQLKALRQPLDVLVATPGRLLDHAQARRVDFARVEVLILDEADRMLDMGFIDDIEAVIARLPARRQTLLFSATLDGVVGRLANRVTRDARRIEIAAAPEQRPQIEQRVLYADDFGHKTRLLDHLLRDAALNQAIVFTATKKSADDLSESLLEQGYAAAALHGDMNQRDRNRTLTQLRRGGMRVLVATDVAARGIDVPGISHVINFDLPRQAEDYVHRIGRTGRAGRAGIAVSLVGHGERHQVRSIERYTDQAIQVDVIAGLEPKARPRPAPAKPRAGGRPGGGERRTASWGTGKPAARRSGSRFER